MSWTIFLPPSHVIYSLPKHHPTLVLLSNHNPLSSFPLRLSTTLRPPPAATSPGEGTLLGQRGLHPRGHASPASVSPRCSGGGRFHSSALGLSSKSRHSRFLHRGTGCSQHRGNLPYRPHVWGGRGQVRPHLNPGSSPGCPSPSRARVIPRDVRAADC